MNYIRNAQMKHSLILTGIVLTLAFISLGVGAGRSGQLVVNDDQPHGDPPYLLEDGWKPLLNGKNLNGWQYRRNPEKGGWGTTAGVFWGGPENPKQLKAIAKSGDRIVNTMTDFKPVPADLFTTEKFGDQELYIEFLLPTESNSGVYVHGLYELQIVDSIKRDDSAPTALCGSVYDYKRQVNNKYVGGVAPLMRAERPAGQWQSFHIWFQAPRFNSAGKKISNAKFIRVLYNGVLIHENVERKAPTRAAMDIPEAATNPLMLQGDHGPVAYRNIYIRPLRPLSKK